MSNHQLYTVKDVARIIAYDQTPDGVARVVRQIRHWTNSDVLAPFGPKDTGTGVSRVYDANGVRKAAIVLELTRYGVTVDMLEAFEEWAAESLNEAWWEAAIDGTEDCLLQFGWAPPDAAFVVWRVGTDGGLLPTRRKGRKQDPNFEVPSVILVNATALFQRLDL